MKSVWAWLLMILFLVRFWMGFVPAATVVGNLVDPSDTPVHGIVSIVPVGAPWASGTNTVTAVAVRQTVTNGQFTATALEGGVYWVYGTNLFPRFMILVPPNDTNTYQLNYLATLATNVPTFWWTNSHLPSSYIVGPGVVGTNNAGMANEQVVIVGTNAP